jgi:hypothetical protein
MLVQIPPLRPGAGDPENSIEHKPMIFWAAPAAWQKPPDLFSAGH